MKKIFSLCFVLLCFVPGLLGGQRTKPAATPIAFTHVTVIDATGAPAKSAMTVVITGDRITALGPTAQVRIPKGARVIEARGKFLLPGLWDMHIHLQEAGERALPVFIANGVTSVRDMGTIMSHIQQYKQQIRDGKVVGPRIKAAGMMISNPMIWDYIQKNLPPDQKAVEAERRIRVETPDDARKAVQAIKQAGADFIKLHWNNNKETYRALADEARQQGLTFAGHDPLGGISLADISDAGQRSIEHFDGSLPGQLRALTEAERQQLYARFKRNGTHFVPTLLLLTVFDRIKGVNDLEARMKLALADPRTPYLSPSLIEGWRRFFTLVPQLPPSAAYNEAVKYLIEMQKAGVRLMPGTDIAVPLVHPGFSLHEELAELVGRLGLSPDEALQGATRYPAEFFGMQADLGTVEVGKLADLLLLDANPLESIHNTKKINAVVVNGRLFDRKALDKLLAQATTATQK